MSNACEVVIVGAGAAGLFAAGTLLEQGCNNVTIVEHMDAPGKKLAITGKGRCNLTNNCDVETFLRNIRTNPRFLYSAANALPPAAVMSLFEDKLGVPLKTERGRRVFPASDRAEDVVEALVRRAKSAKMLRGQAVELVIEGGENGLSGQNDANGRIAGVQLADGRVVKAGAVLVATGGLSYPVTGSTGLGYALAKQAGHTIVPPQPSLVSLVAADAATCRRMAGLSLRNVGLTLLRDGKAVYNEQGEMLFTHFGLSGPMVLSASAYIGDMAKHRYEVAIDLKPALSAEVLDARLQRDFAELANRDTANSLDKLLPASMRGVMLERWGVDPHSKANQITKEERRRLGELTKDFRVAIKRRGDLDHAVITSGGVAVKEVDPKTMQSKKLPGLYFAGEVLDVDGYTGGYNLQVAWCTAWAAARAL